MQKTGMWGLVMGVVLWPVAAMAHPHAWINLDVQLQFDDKGQATGLRETWIFDEFYTSFATAGFDQDHDGKPDQDKLDALTAENLGNLREYDYFTHVTQNGQPIALETMKNPKTWIAKKQVTMAFDVPFKAPVDMGKGTLSYQIYDPTYYAEMLHEKKDGAVALDKGPAPCHIHLSRPTPSEDTVNLAAMLDVTQTPRQPLGQEFAEKVEISCGAKP